MESQKNSTTCCPPAKAEVVTKTSCCVGGCAPVSKDMLLIEAPWVTGVLDSGMGKIASVSPELRFSDHLGAWKARWGFGRMKYLVKPGVYATGRPSEKSPVLVSANYKMSFDVLRSSLTGQDAWILVIDTSGINVWCAAGKGTFSTDEIVRRVKLVQLEKIVSHKTIIVPQLGAPGVNAFEVKKQSGFRVVYGPVRAQDLPAFLDSEMKTTPEMRQVRFTTLDRLVLTPVELVGWSKTAVLIMIALFFTAGLGRDWYSFSRAINTGAFSVLLFLSAYLAGNVLTPVLLPWLPGRSFSVKGAWAGVILTLAVESYGWANPAFFKNTLSATAWIFLLPAITSFFGMNFTGASTYTSLSGVQREMKIAVPIQTVCVVLGLGLWLAGLLV